VACEALGVLLRKAVQTASSRGVSNPFSAEIGILDDDQLDDEVIQRAYQGAPITFFQETWHSVVAIVADNLHRDGVSKPPYRDDIWPHRHSQYIHRLQEKLLRGLDASAQQVPRGIRAHFCYALTPLFGTPFQQQVKDLFRPMWLLDPWLPVDRLVEQFLNFALRLEYEKFGEIMEALLEGEDPQSRVVAARQATITALVVPEARDVTARLILGDEHIRKGMAEVAGYATRGRSFVFSALLYLGGSHKLKLTPNWPVRGGVGGECRSRRRAPACATG
jgi:hypothetical protein